MIRFETAVGGIEIRASAVFAIAEKVDSKGKKVPNRCVVLSAYLEGGAMEVKGSLDGLSELWRQGEMTEVALNTPFDYEIEEEEGEGD